MEALEVLLREEQRVLAGDYTGEPLSELCPYDMHQPYLKLIERRARVISVEKEHRESPIDKQSIETITQFHRGLASRINSKALEAVKKLGEENGVTITQEDLDEYLYGLAGRVIDYVETHLPGMVNEVPDTLELAKERLGQDVGDYEVFMEELSISSNAPDYRIVEIYKHVKLFHETLKQLRGD